MWHEFATSVLFLPGPRKNSPSQVETNQTSHIILDMKMASRNCTEGDFAFSLSFFIFSFYLIINHHADTLVRVFVLSGL